MNEPNTTNQPQPPSGGAGISAFEEAAAELLWLDLAEKASSSPFLSGLIICQSCKNTLTRNIHFVNVMCILGKLSLGLEQMVY